MNSPRPKPARAGPARAETRARAPMATLQTDPRRSEQSEVSTSTVFGSR
jgi:hypothetical protein